VWWFALLRRAESLRGCCAGSMAPRIQGVRQGCPQVPRRDTELMTVFGGCGGGRFGWSTQPLVAGNWQC
jgi:hypothetical protein